MKVHRSTSYVAGVIRCREPEEHTGQPKYHVKALLRILMGRRHLVIWSSSMTSSLPCIIANHAHNDDAVGPVGKTGQRYRNAIQQTTSKPPLLAHKHACMHHTCTHVAFCRATGSLFHRNKWYIGQNSVGCPIFQGSGIACILLVNGMHICYMHGSNLW